MVLSGLFLIAVISAGLMGYAVQRGATCTVAAIGEYVEHGKVNRLRALLETALWVGGGLLIARWLGVLPALPNGYPLSGWTIVGGIMLGLGATLNGACLFGAIARIGNGEWAQLAAPLFFYLGLVSFVPLFRMPIAHSIPPTPIAAMSPALAAAAVVMIGYLAWRLWDIFGHRHVSQPRLHRVWRPHEATLLIGVTFVILLVTFGFWTYTDLLADLSLHRMRNVVSRIILFIALFAGATLGGLTAGRFKLRSFEPIALARSASGGLLMGWGGALTPGGNDWLILVGMPLLWPYAWVSVTAMCATIALLLRWAKQRASQHPARCAGCVDTNSEFRQTLFRRVVVHVR